jgi:glycosyltransferase involved in cell wall biosynthesis
MDKITVIILVKNEEEKIERCLEAVFGQTIQPYEVIVVDGLSTESTFEDTHTKHGSNDNLDLI